MLKSCKQIWNKWVSGYCLALPEMKMKKTHPQKTNKTSTRFKNLLLEQKYKYVNIQTHLKCTQHIYFFQKVYNVWYIIKNKFFSIWIYWTILYWCNKIVKKTTWLHGNSC